MERGSCSKARRSSRGIRNKVLTFVLELEALGIRADDEGKIGAIDTPTNDRITQIFNQTIYGSVSNVGHAGNVSTVSHVVLSNLQSLNTALQAAGVEESEIRDLNAALESDRQAGATTGGRFGRHVSNWLGEMVKKSAQGAIKIGTDVITGVSVTRRTTVRDSVNVVDDFYDIYG
jgi:hypothetical protein